ncbi:ATP-grasp fold amidoligase family protein [Colwellia sp. 1_MG-2023]|uniref:ATP-grasp fold amidoligase family protein n=1 Tax=Colwellia sp. 1_MG-2023 TaxID=3062649 RepID=UPI0026E441A3|nr:ATP-grasp fold amidoligase family protein [Colwellia sp. 1_MG-2023]MDO6444978.1 ATP-grasp fold amidoligase family protein [Colwellia sp. 1_MG-2023]
MNKTNIGEYLYTKGTVGNYFFGVFKTLINIFKYNKFTDTLFTKKHFEKKFGFELNLKSPQTLNEKIQWLKLNDMDDFKAMCSDKYLVREFIKSEIGEEHLIPLVYQTYSFKDINAESLPDFPVIIKTNHASGKVYIIKDKSVQNFSEIQESLKYQLRKNFYHSFREKQYKNIKPCIIVEKFMQDENGDIPKDFKIHCFNGQPTYIQVDTGRYVDQKRVIYDIEWNYVDIKWKENKGDELERPLTLDKMVEKASLLSKKFLYVRVDFYEVDGHLYFGELTFTPGGGSQMFENIEVDKLWGSKLKLPID